MALYFLKYDPAVGEKLLRADFAKTGLPPACYDLGFQFVSLGRWAYSPALERLAIVSLTSDKVPVKRGAAELLGKYGRADAEKPLWDAMEYFRSWWKDREDQLDERIGDEGRQLERRCAPRSEMPTPGCSRTPNSAGCSIFAAANRAGTT